MLTIKEVVTRLGLDTGSDIGNMGAASALLKYFGVEPNLDGKVKTYKGTDVDRIAALRASF